MDFRQRQLALVLVLAISAGDVPGFVPQSFGQASSAPTQTRPVYVVPAAAKNTGAIAARIPSGPSMTIYRGVADTQYEVPHYGLR